MKPLFHTSGPEYIQGIRKAEREVNAEGHALIQYARESLHMTFGCREDAFAHIDSRYNLTGGIINENCRELNPLALPFLSLLREHASPAVSIFGMGAGREAAQVKEVLPHAYLTGYGLSAVNPYLVPKMPYHRMKKTAVHFCEDQKWAQGSEEQQSIVSDLQRYKHTLPPSLLVKAQQVSGEDLFFQTTDIPFIDHQKIGYLPADFLPEGSKEFQYDCCGPFQKMKSTSAFRQLFNSAQSCVSEEGILFIDTLPSCMFTEKQQLLEDLHINHEMFYHTGLLSVIVGKRETLNALLECTPLLHRSEWERLTPQCV